MTDEEEDLSKTQLELQIIRSAEELEKLLLEGEEVITNIRIGNDAKEVERRQIEHEQREEQMKKIDEEAAAATQIFNEINERWETLKLYKDPLDIHASIEDQKQKCEALIKQKDEIIDFLRKEVDRAEIEYEADQYEQKEDLVTLSKRIDKQIDLMRAAYKDELKLISLAIDEERTKVKKENIEKWEELFEQRNELEEQNMVKKIEQQDEFLKDLQDNRVYNEELYRETKIALENENQVLQQEYEHMKAVCLLNGEKLDYNYQILKRREDENLIIRSQQKKLINKLRDEFNRLRTKIEKHKESADLKKAKRTQEIHNLRNSVFQVIKIFLKLIIN